MMSRNATPLLPRPLIRAPALLLGSAIAIVAPAHAQQQEVVAIGDQRYVLTQVNADGMPGFAKDACSIYARDGVCGLACRIDYGDDTGESHFRLFSGPAPVGALQPTGVGRSTFNGPFSHSLTRAGTSTWLANDAPGGTFARVFDDSQQPMFGPIAPLSPDFGVFAYFSTDFDGQDVGVAAGGEAAPGARHTVVFRRFHPDAVAAGDETLVFNSTYTDLNLWDVSLSAVGDGTWLVAYRVRDGQQRHVYYRRIWDNSISPQVDLTTERTAWPSIHALDDGTMLLIVQVTLPSLVSYARRYTLDGVPLSAAIAIGSDYGGVSVRRDGSFAMCVLSQNQPAVRVFDSDFAPIGSATTVVLEESYQLHDFFECDVPISYEEDGTIWVLWAAAYGNGPDGPDPRYLSHLKPFDPGDMNDDRVVDNGDIDAFVLALTAPEVYESLYPGVPFRFIGDMNEDGAFDNGDIDGFVAALLE